MIHASIGGVPCAVLTHPDAMPPPSTLEEELG